MSFHQIIRNLLEDTLGAGDRVGSLGLFAPELIVCATIVALLLARMLLPGAKNGAFYVAVIGTGAALLTAFPGEPKH